MRIDEKVIACSLLLGVYIFIMCKLAQSQVILSDFALKNIEALASYDNVGYICIGEGEKICPATGKGVRMVIITSR